MLPLTSPAVVLQLLFSLFPGNQGNKAVLGALTVFVTAIASEQPTTVVSVKIGALRKKGTCKLDTVHELVGSFGPFGAIGTRQICETLTLAPGVFFSCDTPALRLDSVPFFELLSEL